jgi:cytoskeletal protein CcmA (bactofilin family)
VAIFSNPSPAPKSGDPQPHNRRRTDGIPLSIIGPDMTITGDLETGGTVKIEGRVRGAIHAGAQVLVSQGALIEGDLHTREAVIAGEVRGAIHATERVELQATAVVVGDITTPRIAILEGGRVSGEVKMEVAGAGTIALVEESA